MSHYRINDIKKGLKVLANGEPCEVIDIVQHTPGRRMASPTLPLFVAQGDTIRVDTRTGGYVGRAK